MRHRRIKEQANRDSLKVLFIALAVLVIGYGLGVVFG